MNVSVLDRVSKVIIESAGLDGDETLTAGTALMGAGLALDSMATVELLVGLEKEFGIQIPPDELVEAGAFQTVGSLVAFVESRISI